MTRPLDPAIAIRRVRADDGPALREFRLEALGDPAAPIAFLETRDEAEARPASEWRERAERSAASDDQAGFVAEIEGRLVGIATVIVVAAGKPDYFDRVHDTVRHLVVGIYVAPIARGRGTIGGLLAAAAAWTRAAGHDVLALDVHEDNLPALGAYRRAGFVEVGSFDGEQGREIAMQLTL